MITRHGFRLMVAAILTLALLLGLAGSAAASEFRSAETITIGEGEVIDDRASRDREHRLPIQEFSVLNNRSALITNGASLTTDRGLAYFDGDQTRNLN